MPAGSRAPTEPQDVAPSRTPPPARRGRPWLSVGLLAALGVVAAATLGPEPVRDPHALAWAWGDGPSPALALWWLAHDGGWHLAGNLLALLLFAPALERYVGTGRVAIAVVLGNALGLLAHVGLNVTDRPLLGASATVSALVAYNLVVGWHCPFETRRGGRRRLWPAALFHGLLGVEVARWMVETAAQRPPSGAAAHLGGLAAGVLVCGVLHRRWPAGPAARRARGRGAPPPAVACESAGGAAPAYRSGAAACSCSTRCST